MPLTLEWCERLAVPLRCRPADLMEETAQPSKASPLIGTVDDKCYIKKFAKGEEEEFEDVGVLGVEPVAVKVTGNSLYPHFYSNDLIIFDRGIEFKPQFCLSKQCIVEISKTKILFGELTKGSKVNTYTIKPINQPPVEDVKILTAYRVMLIKRA